MTAEDLFQLRGQTPHFTTFGEEGDTSNICQFGWYEWVYFCETIAELPFPSHIIGCCLGPTKNRGNGMIQWVLKQNEKIVPCQTMRCPTPNELVHDSEVKKRAEFDADTKLQYGDSFTLPNNIRGNTQEADYTCELNFYEVATNIPEADIVDDQGKPLQPTSATDIL